MKVVNLNGSNRSCTKDIVWTVTEGRRVLGTSKSCYWNKANMEQIRNKVQRVITCTGEGNMVVELGTQGSLVKMGQNIALTKRGIHCSNSKFLQSSMFYLYQQTFLSGTYQKHQFARGTPHYNLSSCAIVLSQGRQKFRGEAT